MNTALRLVWSHARLETSQRTVWALTRHHRSELAANYGLDAGLLWQANYGLRIEHSMNLRYGTARSWHRSLACPYSDRRVLRAPLLAPYSSPHVHTKSLRCPYYLTMPRQQALTTPYALSPNEPCRRRFISPWSLQEQARVQAVQHLPELFGLQRLMPLHSASLSCDEDSPYWLARIELSLLSDFVELAIGDRLRLQLGAERFELCIDGKTLSRDDSSTQRFEITALSPLSQYDAPWAHGQTVYAEQAQSARSTVQSLLGQVDWQIADWLIPAGRLQLDNVTPLQAARTLVGAIGGVLESLPDGTALARRRHPLSIPQYRSAEPAHRFTDADVLSSRADSAPQRGFNRIVVSNDAVQGRDTQDNLELLPTDNPQQKRLRAVPEPWRPVQLLHSGHPATVIIERGTITRIETERVEFIDGIARCRYPIDSLLDFHWQHQDLGALEVDGQTLRATHKGYSLLSLRYSTRALEWLVSQSHDEEVQFLLIDGS